MSDLLPERAALERAEGAGYGPRRIPDPLDSLVNGFLEHWRSASAEEKAEVQVVMTLELGRLFTAYSERMASLAVRNSDTEPLEHALLAYALKGGVNDFRDRLPTLALLNRSADLLGEPLGHIFSRLEPDLPEPNRTEIARFISRAPEDKTLTAMGFEESADENGFRHRRLW